MTQPYLMQADQLQQNKSRCMHDYAQPTPSTLLQPAKCKCSILRITEAYCNSMEVVFKPLLALAALQQGDCYVDSPTLKQQLGGPQAKAEQGVLGGLAGLPSQLVELPGEGLPAQRPAALTGNEAIYIAGMSPSFNLVGRGRQDEA